MDYSAFRNTFWVDSVSGSLFEFSAKVALVLSSYSEECFEILIQKECFYGLVLN